MSKPKKAKWALNAQDAMKRSKLRIHDVNKLNFPENYIDVNIYKNMEFATWQSRLSLIQSCMSAGLPVQILED